MKDPLSFLKDEAQKEAYDYFSQKIRPLDKLPNGEVDPAARGLQDNDVDAFRHAYVSGRFTQVHGEPIADMLGRLNELNPAGAYSNSNDPRAINMDLWNNKVGRKYGKKTKGRKTLLKLIHKALKNGELIINLSDPREFRGAKNEPKRVSKPVIVIEENKKGRNELFYDVIKKITFNRDEFILRIKGGEYPGYAIKRVNGILTPVSNPDSKIPNNLT